MLQLHELVCVLHVLDNLHLGRISELTELDSVDLVGLQLPLLLHITVDPHHSGMLELPELGSVALAGVLLPLIDCLVLQYAIGIYFTTQFTLVVLLFPCVVSEHVLLQQLSLGSGHVHLLNIPAEPLT